MSQSKEWHESFPAKEQLVLCCPQAPLLRSTLQAEDYESLRNEGEEELEMSEVVWWMLTGWDWLCGILGIDALGNLHFTAPANAHSEEKGLSPDYFGGVSKQTLSAASPGCSVSWRWCQWQEARVRLTGSCSKKVPGIHGAAEKMKVV